MSEIKFSVNETIDVHKNTTTKKIDSKYLVIHSPSANWLTLTKEEFFFFYNLQNKLSIKESLVMIYNSLSLCEDKCLSICESVLEKIYNYDFLSKNKGEEEELIENIKKNIQINITSDCNLHCKHCYLSAGKKNRQYLDFIKIKKFISKIDRDKVSDEIVISGGEPLLYKEIFPILKFLRKKNFNIILFTNGTLINESNIKDIAKYVDSIQVSMEGITKEYFEIIRGKNSYSKVMHAIELIKKENIKLVIALTILDSTIDDIENNIDYFCSQLNYDKLEIRLNNVIEKKGNAIKLPNSFFIKSELREEKTENILQKIISNGFSKPSKENRGIKFKNCGIGASIVINQDGLIYPCNDFSFNQGLSIDTDVDVIEYFNQLNRETSYKNIINCNNCDVGFFCCGGCKIKNKLDNGDYKIPTCNKYEIYKKMISRN
ncbi:radical SAM/SPASM domain-containing protein [Proteus faecis]|uniref:radical SAM/SPASM domain-containing protein n=1 Tax=Proteus faecis TaxID=2050967 RepID=UPI00301C0BBC